MAESAEKWSDIPQEERDRILDMLAEDRSRRLAERSNAAAGAATRTEGSDESRASSSRDFQILSANIGGRASSLHTSSQTQSVLNAGHATGCVASPVSSGLAPADSGLGWRASTSLGTGNAAPVSAARFNAYSGQAVSTVRGRGSMGMGKPIPPVKVQGNKIQLMPARAWGKHMTSVGKTEELDVFLLRQRCEINSNQIKTSYTPAEVMQTIIQEFGKKGWDLTKAGFSYGKVRGKQLELISADLDTHEVDGVKLQDEFAKSRCFVVADTDEWPIEFKEYFQDPAAPAVRDQKRETLSECEYCLLVLPDSSMVDHTAECPRFTAGFPSVPRTIGPPNTVAGGAPINLSAHEFWRADTAGIHLPDNFQFDKDEPKHQRNSQRISDWDDPKAWCLCKGIGAGKKVDWVECARKKKCVVRWYHYECMSLAAGGGDLDDGWTCFLCAKLDTRLPKKKRRRQDLDVEVDEDFSDDNEGPARQRARR